MATPTEPAPTTNTTTRERPEPTRIPGPGRASIPPMGWSLGGEIVEAPPPLKPGYRTTEFWLSLLAMLLTSLYASGAIPTSGTVAMIVGSTATVLTALGYKVSRALVKRAAALSLAAFLAVGCTGVKHPGPALIDCTAADHAQIDALIADLATKRKPDGSRDWAAIGAEAIAAGVRIGGCALVELVAPVLAPAASSGLAARTGAAPDPGQAALERARAHWGDVRWSTTEGVR